jgi:hypothetical protein
MKSQLGNEFDITIPLPGVRHEQRPEISAFPDS